MSRDSNATPLIGLDAVVIDTETTGLDAAKARIVEIAAVPITAGRVDAGAAFRALVRPDEPVPEAATRIHGIDEAALAGARSFAEIWPACAAAIGSRIVIGHTLGFDLAVLKRECERAGMAWKRPRSLDTRLFAEVAGNDLAGYSLGQLAAWLNVAASGRHSALGDATMTGQVFLALLPELRRGGIRTLAEAQQACRALTEVLDEQHRAGWLEPVEAPTRRDAERSLARIDSYPYRHRISEVMSVPPRFVSADTTVADALAVMARERISSLFVATASAPPAPPRTHETGIITERDVLRALAERGSAAVAAPVRDVMSSPLASVPADAFVYRAIGRMSRLKVR